MIEIAQQYYNLGFCVVPASDQKRPIGKWKQLQIERPIPNGNFLSTKRMGIICGKVSGNLEVLDFDLKYDLTGNLFERFKKEVNLINKDILKKMVVQKTQNNGYHFFYLCDEIEGNTALAKREATAEEVEKDPKDKIKVLIETRGQGGFIMTYPSEGYAWIYGDLSKISRITPEERAILFGCARTFNEVFDVAPVKHKEYTSSHTVFDKWNESGDVETILEDDGWTFKGICNGNRMYLRPNGTQEWSAGYHPETKLFRVFTTSSEFTNDTTYNPTQVLAYLRFGKDLHETAKWLEKNGYGVENTQITHTSTFSEVNIEDTNDFVATEEEADSYITQIRDGTFQMGLSTGLLSLDKHWLFKPSLLVLILGHDNVGKSVFGWFLAAQSAKLHGWKWIIWAAENRIGGVKKKIIEFYLCKRIKDISEEELAEAKVWFKKYFTLIKNNKLYTYKDMLAIGRKLNAQEQRNAFMIDPYNGLYKETDNEHLYDYHAMQEMLLFRDETKCGIYLNVHAITEALRRRYPKGHDLEGQPMPPHKADTEGGGKFSNKADDFIIVHRMPQHKERWMEMEVHIQKIKEAESGGKQTVLNEPVMLKMMRGSVGYEEMNPVGQQSSQNFIDYTEPKKEECETLPF